MYFNIIDSRTLTQVRDFFAVSTSCKTCSAPFSLPMAESSLARLSAFSGFCVGNGERMCVCCYVARRRLDGVAVRGSHRSRVVAERALPRRRAPAVRAADRCADARPRIISQTALRRAFLGRTPGAHVKVLVSHDASEGARCASLVAGAASRRATLNLWLRA